MFVGVAEVTCVALVVAPGSDSFGAEVGAGADRVVGALLIVYSSIEGGIRCSSDDVDLRTSAHKMPWSRFPCHLMHACSMLY